MRLSRLAALLIALALGAALGLSATWAALRRGFAFDSIVAGPWVAHPRAGALARDPYAAALAAATGEAPMDVTEGVAFFAREDSAGRALSGACFYRLRGPAPAARYWTLTVTDDEGRLIDNPAGRHSLVSGEIVRAENGAFEIALGPLARPGASIPTMGVGEMRIALRLYDAAIGATGAPEASALPSIERVACP